MLPEIDKIKNFFNAALPSVRAAFVNLLLVCVCFGVCRLAIFLLGWDESFGEKSFEILSSIFLPGIEFDVAAVLVVNALWLFLCFLPVRSRWFDIFSKSLFVLLNGFVLFISLCDTAFFHYANRRLSVSMLKEFAGETNLHKIFFAELVNSWQLVLLFALMIAALWLGYRNRRYVRSAWNMTAWGLLFTAVILSFCGKSVINPSKDLDEDYISGIVNNNRQKDFVINTPFKIYFSSQKQELDIPDYFSKEELGEIFPIVHQPDSSRAVSKRNVMVIIVESLSQELMDERLMPFLDSLRTESAHFTRSYANCAISIDAMPAVFSSIPRMKSPFVLSHNDNSHIPSLPRELRSWGYHTAFFHGGNNASMGFQAFARSIGFEKYLGREEYNADSRFNGDDDFDGTWAVWDERFLQFAALQLGEMKQPFLAGVFTATSHHPYAVPKDFSPTNSGNTRQKMERAVNYTDYALRRFFETAKRQTWYENTIFIITADHVNPISKTRRHKGRRYRGLRHIEIPIFIFDPQKVVEPRLHDGIIQQIDIMPTVLSIIGYDREFISLGKDALDEDATQWAFNCNQFPQYIEGDFILSMRNSGHGLLFDCRNSGHRMNDLSDSMPELARRMENKAKAMMQCYKNL